MTSCSCQSTQPRKRTLERERDHGGGASTRIIIYPVKSYRGISVSQAPITPTGFRWDRQWLIVNSKGRAFTQRSEPKLALVQVELPIQAFTEEWQPTHNSYMVFQPQRRGLSTLTKFSDAFPFLLLSQGSMDALNKLLNEPLSVNRFRPNILVDGCEPYSEDLWKEIKINNSAFGSAMLCYRCKVPNTNQETAEVGPEPTETLKTFRSNKVLFPTRKQQGRVLHWTNVSPHGFMSLRQYLPVPMQLYNYGIF